MMVKRVYFGNWLRDYSQAVDVGTLKVVQADTIRSVGDLVGLHSWNNHADVGTQDFGVGSQLSELRLCNGYYRSLILRNAG